MKTYDQNDFQKDLLATFKKLSGIQTSSAQLRYVTDSARHILDVDSSTNVDRKYVERTTEEVEFPQTLESFQKRKLNEICKAAKILCNRATSPDDVAAIDKLLRNAVDYSIDIGYHGIACEFLKLYNTCAMRTKLNEEYMLSSLTNIVDGYSFRSIMTGEDYSIEAAQVISDIYDGKYGVKFHDIETKRNLLNMYNGGTWVDKKFFTQERLISRASLLENATLDRTN